MIDNNIISDIAKLLKTRETFEIIDRNGIGKCKVMIIGISHREKKDDLLKVIDMSEMSDTFEVFDYDFTTTDLHNAIKLARETKKV